MALRAPTPAQQQVTEQLFAQGQPRPSFPNDLADRLRNDLEEGLRPLKETLIDQETMFVSKSTLARVHQCELHWWAEKDSFAWSARAATGIVAHRAIELAQGMRADLSPTDLVNRAIDRIIENGQPLSLSEFLQEIADDDQSDLILGATDCVTKFQDSFPVLDPAMRPRLESGLRLELLDGAVLLSGKVDLALGRANGNESRVLIVDLKTGRPSAAHADDLRFYALLETLRVGIPPFRVASFYLDSGTWRHEDVDEQLLESTVRRVVDGVTKLAELTAKTREPEFTPCPSCTYCILDDTCEGAVIWRATKGYEEPLDP